MPYIKMTTNLALEQEKSEILKAKFGKAIEAFPGKSEAWLMLAFEGEKPMCFKGSDAPCAMLDISIYGAVNAAAADKMTALVTEIVSGELAIDPSRIYVKYQGIENWGWNGANF